MSEVLEQRFERFKKSIKIKKYGIQWEKDRKNFSVSYRKGVFENLGDWSFDISFNISLELVIIISLNIFVDVGYVFSFE